MKKKIGMMAAAFAVAMAGSLGTAQVAQSTQPTTASQRASEMKSTAPTKSTPRKIVVQSSGGLDVIREGGQFGMTPKEYGMRYGNGKSRKGKTNMLRVSKNARRANR